MSDQGIYLTGRKEGRHKIRRRQVAHMPACYSIITIKVMCIASCEKEFSSHRTFSVCVYYEYQSVKCNFS